MIGTAIPFIGKSFYLSPFYTCSMLKEYIFPVFQFSGAWQLVGAAIGVAGSSRDKSSLSYHKNIFICTCSTVIELVTSNARCRSRDEPACFSRPSTTEHSTVSLHLWRRTLREPPASSFRMAKCLGPALGSSQRSLAAERTLTPRTKQL